MSVFNEIFRRLRTIVDRAVVVRIQYEGNVRTVQISARPGTAGNGLEHVEPYGITSHPLPGALAETLNAGGKSGKAIVIVIGDRRHRIVVDEGEVAIYHHSGDRVHLKNGGEVHVKAATRVFLETPLVECSSNLRVNGNSTFVGTALFQSSVMMQNTLNVTGNVSFASGLAVAGITNGTGNFVTLGNVIIQGVAVLGHRHQENDVGGLTEVME